MINKNYRYALRLMAAVCVVQCMVCPLRAENTLVDRLVSPDIRVHNPALDELRTLDADARRKLVAPLLQKLAQETDEKTRMQAIWALGALGSDAQEAVPTLLGLGHDPSPGISAWTRDSLSKIAPQSKDVVSLLIDVLLHDQNWQSRAGAA